MKIKQKFIILLLPLLLLAPLKAIERTQHGEDWNAFPKLAKFTYVSGVRDASFYALSQAQGELFNHVEPQKLLKALDDFKKLSNKLELNVDIRDLVKGMDYLYSDPANNYVSFRNILYFAKDRMQGIDIREALQKERRESEEFWKTISSQ